MEKGRNQFEKSKDSFSVLLNPESYSEQSSIKYSGKELVTGNKFVSLPSTSFSFGPIFFDVTGAIPGTAGKKIKDYLDALKKVVLVYEGANHETPVVEISWGSLHVFARLNDMQVDYLLFDNDGIPLRAKVTLKFSHYEKLDVILARQNKQSPDLTHVIEVKAGDTLPNLCAKIYNDPSYYVDVARINNLSSFRNLKPGTKLNFPPLVN